MLIIYKYIKLKNRVQQTEKQQINNHAYPYKLVFLINRPKLANQNLELNTHKTDDTYIKINKCQTPTKKN